jgi:hypothetical protein
LAGSQQNYYLLSALADPGPFGSEPPLAPAEFLEALGVNPGAAELTRALFLSDDLLQREAVVTGEIDAPEPIVLSVEQVRDEAELPEELLAQVPQTPRRVAADALWEAYYRYVAELADRTGGGFLRRWVGFEVGLRNALATARARALGLEAAEYTVAEDLAEDDAMISWAVSEWSQAGDPLVATRALDRARYEWLHANDDWFAFSDDELIAYAAKLMILSRWQRLSEARQDGQSSPPVGAEA